MLIRKGLLTYHLVYIKIGEHVLFYLSKIICCMFQI